MDNWLTALVRERTGEELSARLIEVLGIVFDQFIRPEDVPMHCPAPILFGDADAITQNKFLSSKVYMALGRGD